MLVGRSSDLFQSHLGIYSHSMPRAYLVVDNNMLLNSHRRVAISFKGQGLTNQCGMGGFWLKKYLQTHLYH